MKPTVISADVLFEDHRSSLHWEWVAGLGASERKFDEVAIREARSGADLVGYLNYIHPYRVQIVGRREVAYLTDADAEDCERRIARIVTLEPPALAVLVVATAPDRLVVGAVALAGGLGMLLVGRARVRAGLRRLPGAGRGKG